MAGGKARERASDAEGAKKGRRSRSRSGGAVAPATGSTASEFSAAEVDPKPRSGIANKFTRLTSSTGRSFDVDLFGEPIVRGLGRGRPPHVPTPATRALVAEMGKAGATGKAIAHAIGVGRSTLYRDYAAELGLRPNARRRAAGRATRRRGALSKENGNVE